MDVEGVILTVIGFLADAVGWILGLIPNPDPFPQMLDDLQIEGSEPWAVAWYWISQFVDVPLVVEWLFLMFSMFAVGWLILTLWKWVKTR